MWEYLSPKGQEVDPDMKKLFVKCNMFEELLKETFGNPDEKREAERKLYNLE